ncbi:MAG: hypothetical protein EXR92_00040 [Gemmatimonadetes bacterium]|nr:hypothetical protein [Gemmatimonadota bacterium]
MAELYLVTNKIWKRKHERAVADSISMMGEFVGIIPLFFLALSLILSGNWTAAINPILWMSGGCITIAIGAGVWVEGKRGRNFTSLVRDAIRMERGEVTALARSFFRPAAASKILDILARLALIDHDFDTRERTFLQTFADAWGIGFPVIVQGDGRGYSAFTALHDDAAEYLATSPPPSQVRQFGEVARVLVRIDERVTDEEATMLAELEGMWDAYLDGTDAAPAYVVALVPQSKEQDHAIASVLRSARRTPIHGGEAYVAGTYHSERFAEIVGNDYRALNIFTTVIRLTTPLPPMPSTEEGPLLV